MKTLKKIGIAIVVIAVLAVAAFLILRKSEKPQMKYKTAEIHRGSIVNTVTATGTIEPIVQVEVGTQVSGIINHIYVDYNSVVKKRRGDRRIGQNDVGGGFGVQFRDFAVQ